MSARVWRMLIGFSAALGAYWLYAIVAAPLIEPQVRRMDKAPPAPPRVERRRLDHLFPPGSWELDQPKVLETDEGMLLFKDYEPRGDGSMELHPFTLIFYSKGRDDEEAGREEDGGRRQARPIVMRAPEGAVLRFEDALDLTRAKIGRLAGGALLGEITIQSPESLPGAGDALEVSTRQIQIDRKHVWTTHPVHFRFGKSYGSGRDLLIELAAKRSGSGDKAQAALIGGVKSLELVHVDKVHIQLDQARSPAGGPPEAGAPDAGQPGRPAAAPPPEQPTVLDVACRGSFRFDFEQMAASFENQVEAIRPSPDGASDQLSCQLLSIRFAARTGEPRGSDDRPAAPKAGVPRAAAQRAWSDLQLELVTADGQPAVLRAPSSGVSARGEHLEYSLRTGRIRLEDRRMAAFEQSGRRIEAPQLQYDFDVRDPRRLNRLWAGGPGRILAAGGEGRSAIEAAWGKELLFEPGEGGSLLSLIASASFAQAGVGRLTANAIYVWLVETPIDPAAQTLQPRSSLEAAGRSAPATAESDPWRRMQPTRMLVEGAVEMDSQRFSGSTNRLELWFRRPQDGSAAEAAAGERPSVASSAAAAMGTPSGEPTGAKFGLRADLVQVQLLLGEQASVENLTVRGGVRIEQLTRPDPEQPPLQIEGDLLRLDNTALEAASARVVGRPARVSAGGLAIASGVIRLAQGANRLWIDEAGEMTLPSPSKVPLRGVHDRQPTTIAWSGRMEFDGLEAHFERDVEVRAVQLQEDGGANAIAARGGVLDVELTRRLDFSKPQQRDGVDVRSFAFPIGAVVENQNRDKLGRQQSYDRLTSRTLSINAQNGRLKADGPGWISSHRYGQAPLLVSPNAPPLRPQSSSSQLSYLRVDFQNGMDGDFFKREVVFHDWVTAVYGPVSAWDGQLDPRSREGLGEKGVLLNCNVLRVAEMGRTVGAPRSVELEAEGNTSIVGGMFAGRGSRIKYVEAKDTVVLEGDGRNKAELTQQTKPGLEPTAFQARKITYRLSDRNIQFEDVQGLRYRSANALWPKTADPPRTAPR